MSGARNSRAFGWNTEGGFGNYWDYLLVQKKSRLMGFCLKQLLFNDFYFKLFLQSSISSGQYCRMSVLSFL